MDQILNQAIAIAQGNLPAAVGAGLLLLFFLYRKPKMVLSFLVLGILLVTVYTLISDASTASGKKKQKMFHTY